jgi:hypothetical protein
VASFGGIGFVRGAECVFELETGINGFVWKYGVVGRGGFDLRIWFGWRGLAWFDRDWHIFGSATRARVVANLYFL